MSASQGIVFVGVAAGVIALLAMVPVIVDAYRTAGWRARLIESVAAPRSKDEYLALLRVLREPRGVRGLTRSLIAITIVSLVGLALVVSMLSGGSDAVDLRKTLVTALTTVLATLGGFYFGSRAAENAADDNAAAAAAACPDTPPVVTSVAPATAAPGETVTVTGTGFTGATAVRFAGRSSTPTDVTDTRLQAVVPGGGAGPAPVVVETPSGTSAPYGGFSYPA